MKKISPIKIKPNQKTTDLVEQMKNAGFGARKIGLASEIAKEIFSDDKTQLFIGLAGAMVPAGMKQIIIDLLKEKPGSILVTTGANLTHDLIEALNHSHYHCDSWDDEEFNKKGFDRMYNVLMKNDVYQDLENFFEENWDKLSKSGSQSELIKNIAKLLPKDSNSILKTALDNNVEIFCPALSDSGIGLMIWGRLAAGKTTNIDAFKDMNQIIDTAWTASKKAIVYIGGGTPKNFIQQSLQFSSGADFAIQITTDQAHPGGSSGAPLEEGKSWGKLKPKATHVDVNCDATIALPLIFSDVIKK